MTGVGLLETFIARCVPRVISNVGSLWNLFLAKNGLYYRVSNEVSGTAFYHKNKIQEFLYTKIGIKNNLFFMVFLKIKIYFKYVV